MLTRRSHQMLRSLLVVLHELLPYLGTIDSLTDALLGVNGNYVMEVEDGYEVIDVVRMKPLQFLRMPPTSPDIPLSGNP